MRYAPNVREYELPGIEDNRGANNPLTSAHSGGVNVLLADGAVQFLAEEIDIVGLKKLSTRDDSAL